MPTLFEPAAAGEITLRNRIVMAPMTRARAGQDASPGDHHALYYSQRASSGLIVTEGVAPSPDGLGYARTPGLFTEQHVNDWRQVTDAVHRHGGSIVVQLMHVGRIAHPLNQPPGARVVAPSPVAAAGTMWTDAAGAQRFPVPHELTTGEITAVIEEYAHAVRNARAAGFDGVELHAANGYLPSQFLSPNTNRRTDAYGGSPERRGRFVLELFEAAANAWSPGRVGVRVSPGGSFNDIRDPEAHLTFPSLAEQLSKRGAAYLHVARPFPFVPAEAQFNVPGVLRERFQGTLILAGELSGAEGAQLIASGAADLVAFGRPFISNPDLPDRLRHGWPLAKPNPATFYTPGPAGYIDYPAHTQAAYAS